MSKTSVTSARDQRCSVIKEDGEQCERLVGGGGARGFCKKHYYHVKKYGDPLAGGFHQKKDPEQVALCSDPSGCDNPAETKGLCKRHYDSKRHRENKPNRPSRAGQPWRKLTPAQQEAKNHKSQLRNHHVTQEWWDATLQEQAGLCGAGCGASEPGGRGAWHIDHDHSCCPGDVSCGKCVRGLVCHGCNGGMGQMKDDPARLRAAADYLEFHQERFATIHEAEALIASHQDLIKS